MAQRQSPWQLRETPPPLFTRESPSSTIPKPLVPHQPLQWTGENHETAPIRVNRFPPQTFSRPNQVQSIVQIQYSRVCFINRYYAGPNWRQESSPRWPSCLLCRVSKLLISGFSVQASPSPLMIWGWGAKVHEQNSFECLPLQPSVHLGRHAAAHVHVINKLPTVSKSSKGRAGVEHLWSRSRTFWCFNSKSVT